MLYGTVSAFYLPLTGKNVGQFTVNNANSTRFILQKTKYKSEIPSQFHQALA